MIVEGKCNTCNKYFDAHWHNYPMGTKEYCLYCKSPDVTIWTDEHDSDHEEILFDDEED